MSALDEGGIWCGTCHRSALHAAETGGCICDPAPHARPAVPAAAAERATYVVSVTADEHARVAVDLTIDEDDLIRCIAGTLDGIGAYSGRIHIRPGGGPDPDCSSCNGSGRPLYADDPDVDDDVTCDCVPTATVERRTGGAE